MDTIDSETYQSNEDYKDLIEDAPLGYQSLDANGCFRYVNKTWLEMMGYEKHEVIGKWFGDFITSEFADLFKQNFPKFKELGHTCVLFKMIRKDKKILSINFTGKISYNPDGSFKHTHCILEDISMKLKCEEERKIMQERLWHQQKLESISTLAGGVAHEINNPINGILNYGQIIFDSTDSDSELNKYAAEIIYESNRVSNIVKNLLDFSKQSGKYHSYAQIYDIIDKTISLVKEVFRHDNININIEIEPDISNIKCRSQQIQQVLMNLITNSRDALNKKYPGYHENKIINLVCNEFHKDERKWISILVEDFGTGIQDCHINHIFDPFFSTKNKDKGTGLGLSISYGIVEEHHGEISVDTKEGEYTRFRIILPCDNGW